MIIGTIGFLNDYIENKIFSIDPFVSIDDGVGDLVKIAAEQGKKQNKSIKLGICGEHGGDPKSIEFCSKVSGSILPFNELTIIPNKTNSFIKRDNFHNSQ